MSEAADRYRAVAEGFTRRARAVPETAWERPAPCDGWVARDVVGHLVEWIPPFLHDGAGVELPAGPSIDTDPAQAWLTMSDGIQTLLDDPRQASRSFSHARAGQHRLDEAIAMFILGDVLIHSWDLARATGLDETLDGVEVARMFDGLQGIDELLRQSGQYGPKIDAGENADVQTRLIAFTGRRP
ncbi:MAG: TIGR03086 family metal-binding protein [Actinomycetota bacterium]|nr:TIGR03086 family metal-binding protein [Actinomycetota bacterium]